jgi:hypothetical protein
MGDYDESCCYANAVGEKCWCAPFNPRTSQQAEDDGYADWKYDQMRDERDMDDE